ncbi:hypothetical protein M885DRAFT_213825 [Pelagophyceae sp. CCMP2097]|nr:hypothetical protein M885DRAFT_213825 [Pelagophyceae sp. CCMP2097]
MHRNELGSPYSRVLPFLFRDPPRLLRLVDGVEQLWGVEALLLESFLKCFQVFVVKGSKLLQRFSPQSVKQQRRLEAHLRKGPGQGGEAVRRGVVQLAGGFQGNLRGNSRGNIPASCGHPSISSRAFHLAASRQRGHPGVVRRVTAPGGFRRLGIPPLSAATGSFPPALVGPLRLLSGPLLRLYSELLRGRLGAPSSD